jgi:transglutaminase-like putative cysteine protease
MTPPRTYRIQHRTDYDYDEPVTMSYGRAHLSPRTGEGQRLVDATLMVEPRPAERRDHVDFFGNLSSYFSVETEHRHLAVVATSTVQVQRTAPADAILESTSWEQVREGSLASEATRAFRLPSPRIRPSGAVLDYASSSFTSGRPIGGVLRDLCSRIHRDFEYRSGSTTVATTVPELLRRRAGVCQDFSHLMVSCVRSVGLSARYVSGYLETRPPSGQRKLLGADASHAWASVFVPGCGWVDVDPTNDQFVDDRYVVLAHGRDYDDVPPLKGVILSDASRSTMRVRVDVSCV